MHSAGNCKHVFLKLTHLRHQTVWKFPYRKRSTFLQADRDELALRAGHSREVLQTYTAENN